MGDEAYEAVTLPSRVKTTDHAITCVVCYPTFTHLPRGYAVQAEAWSEMTREAAAAGAATPSKGNVGSTLGVEVEEFEAEDDDEGEAEDECGDEASDAEAMPTREMVLVVQKIDSLRVKERVAVLWLVLPPDPDEAPEEPLVLHAHDLSRPVTTFASVVESPDCTWVPMDVYWAGAGSSTGPPSIHVRLLQLALDCISCDFYQVTFILNRIAQASEMSPSPLLLSTLNGVSAIPATEREISVLQLYESLTSLPKNIDATHNPIRDAANETSASATTVAGKRNAKAAGKMRTRMALLQRGVETDDVMDES